MPGLAAPARYPIRQPTDPKQRNGRIWNPVRFLQIGGADSPRRWFRFFGPSRMADSSNEGYLKVEKPIAGSAPVRKPSRSAED